MVQKFIASTEPTPWKFHSSLKEPNCKNKFTWTEYLSMLPINIRIFFLMVSNFFVCCVLASICNPAVSFSAYISFVLQWVKPLAQLSYLMGSISTEGSFHFYKPAYRRVQLFCCYCLLIVLGNYLGEVKWLPTWREPFGWPSSLNLDKVLRCFSFSGNASMLVELFDQNHLEAPTYIGPTQGWEKDVRLYLRLYRRLPTTQLTECPVVWKSFVRQWVTFWMLLPVLSNLRL